MYVFKNPCLKKKPKTHKPLCPNFSFFEKTLLLLNQVDYEHPTESHQPT